MMMSKEFDVFFVYGTLKVGEVRGVVWDEFLGEDGYKVEPASIQGELYDLGAFPAAIDGEGTISGQAIYVPKRESPEITRLLDRIEGYYGPHSPHNLYRRVRVRVNTSQGEVEGTTYFFDRPDSLDGRDPIPSGSWSDDNVITLSGSPGYF